jgi:hypothetical protein
VFQCSSYSPPETVTEVLKWNCTTPIEEMENRKKYCKFIHTLHVITIIHLYNILLLWQYPHIILLLSDVIHYFYFNHYVCYFQNFLFIYNRAYKYEAFISSSSVIDLKMLKIQGMNTYIYSVCVKKDWAHRYFVPKIARA